jgi:hypothetical protein
MRPARSQRTEPGTIEGDPPRRPEGHPVCPVGPGTRPWQGFDPGYPTHDLPEMGPGAWLPGGRELPGSDQRARQGSPGTPAGSSPGAGRRGRAGLSLFGPALPPCGAHT